MQPDPEQLRSVPLFQEVDDTARERLSAWMEIERYEEGWSLTHEGRSGYSFFILSEGSVEIQHEGATVATLGPGDVFGELAMLLDGHRQADAIARSDITVFAMFGTQFHEMQAEMPTVADRLDALAAERKAMLD